MNTSSPRVACATLLGANAEGLVNLLCRIPPATGEMDGPSARIEYVASRLGLSAGELSCGLGFNVLLPELPDVLALLGIGDIQSLYRARDGYLVEDVYHALSLESVLAIHAHAAGHPTVADILQPLLDRRLPALEARIERTVHAPTIERYRNELRALYRLGLMPLERFEARLARPHDGFRALVNEVLLAAETRLVPVGVLLYRDDILPREKQQLIRRGLLPAGLLQQRVESADIAPAERELLLRELRLMQPD